MGMGGNKVRGRPTLRHCALAAKLKLVQVPLELLKGREFRLIGYPMEREVHQ